MFDKCDDQLVEDAARALCARRGLTPEAPSMLTRGGRILTNWEAQAQTIRREVRAHIIDLYLTNTGETP